MKLLLVTEYFPPAIFGGGELSAFLLAKELAKKEIEIHVLTSYFKGLKKEETKDKIHIHRLLATGKNPKTIKGNLQRLFLKKQIKKQISLLDKKHDFYLIHFLNTTSIVKYKNKKTYATINGYTNFCPKRNLWYKEKDVCRGCNPVKFTGCIASSDYLGKVKMPGVIRYNPVMWLALYVEYLRNKNSLKHVDRIIVLSDFIESLVNRECKKIPNVMEITPAKKYKLNSKKVKVLYVGGEKKHKGIDLLEKDFRKIKNAHLFIAGTKKKNTKNITYLGKLEYKYMGSLFQQADIVVIPSLWPEPLSRAMIEALYYGCPIIATYRGGNPEGVKNNINGFLVEPAELYGKLKLLIASKKLRKEFSKQSKRIYKEKFEKEKILKKIIEYYKE